MARGTRFPRSKAVSGSTFTTIPSGVTIDANGISLPSSLYTVSYTAANYKVSGGSVAWAGTSVTATHGMSNALTGFGATHYNPGGVSVFQPVIFAPSPVAGGISIALEGLTAVGGASMAVSGGTIYWMAFGY